MKRLFRNLLISVTLIVLTTVGYYVLPPLIMPTTPPPSAELLPDIPGYTVIEGQTVTGYIGSFADGAELLRESDLGDSIRKVDEVIACYQEVGAVRARIYTSDTEPLSAGIIAIGDRSAILNPVNLFGCVEGTVSDQSQNLVPVLQPCIHTYTLPKEETDFYILYAGTTATICQDFCANLEGCVSSSAATQPQK